MVSIEVIINVTLIVLVGFMSMMAVAYRYTNDEKYLINTFMFLVLLLAVVILYMYI